MTTTLSEYLLKLGSDAKALNEFKRNPKHALQSSGLSAEHQTVVEGGNAVAIRKALYAEADAHGKEHPATDWVVVVVITKDPTKE